jgi:hypothetical protein
MNSFETNSEHKARENPASIRGIVADVNRFLIDWIDRFEKCASEAAGSQQPDEMLKRQIQEFESCHASWEVQRQTEQASLEETAQQLTEAWLRLEDEQRALLQSGASPQVGNLASPTMIQPRAGDLQLPTTEQKPGIDQAAGVAPPPAVVDRSPLPVANVRVSLPQDVLPRDVALRQFEKLKNEIQPTGR